MALPRHERDQQVAPQSHLTVLRARAVGEHLSVLDAVALVDDRLLVERRALVGPAELGHPIGDERAVVVLHGNEVGGELLDDAGLGRDDNVTGVDRGAVFHPGTHQRGLPTQQRDRLALHVGAHQGPVGVVVLEERDERGGDRDHLAR